MRFIAQVPVTRTTGEEREALIRGEAPAGWSSKRLAHMDRDARWTKKYGKSWFGYKLHVNVDDGQT